MDGYTLLAGFLLFFLFFIYITWFGFSIKVENEKEDGPKIKIIDLGNHILIIGFILAVIFVSLNVD